MAEVEVQTIAEVATVAVDQPAIEEKPEEAVVGEPKPEKAKAKKKSAPRKASTHPPFYSMVSDAIVTLKERSGSSQYAIQKFAEDKHKQLPPNFRKLLLVQLKRFVASKKLVKVKNSYKLPATKAPSPPKPAAKKTTVTKPKTGIAAKKRTAKKPIAKSPAKLKSKVLSKVKPKGKSAGKPKVTAKPKAPAAKPKATAVVKRKAVAKPKTKAKPSKVAKTSAAASPSAKKSPVAAKTKKKAAAPAKKAVAPAKKNVGKAKSTPNKAKSVKAPARRTSARKSSAK